MVERKLTGAHYGLRDWAMQRATAVIMLIYTVALLVILFTLLDVPVGPQRDLQGHLKASGAPLGRALPTRHPTTNGGVVA